MARLHGLGWPHRHPDSLTTLYPSLRVRGDIAFIGLSTACPKPPFMATGTVGPEQLARLPALLDNTAARGLFRVVYLHHSLLPGKDTWRKRLTDAAQCSRFNPSRGGAGTQRPRSSRPLR